MEDFDDLESEYVEGRFPTELKLKEIKQMLITGERDQILESVEQIKTFLNSEKFCEILMSDICEFLCDAIIPFDSAIVCNSYSCIELMTKHTEFFSHNHSCFAIESLVRTLHFIMKTPSNISSLNKCLSLLNIIMQGYNTHDVPLEKKTTETLLQLLPTLVTNLSPTVSNKYETGALIYSLIKLGVLKLSKEASELLLLNFSSWFSLLIQVLESEHPMKEKLILLCSLLCHSVLRFLVSNESSVNESNFDIELNLKIEIIQNVVEFLTSVALPYFDAVPLSETENDPTNAENFFQIILSFYNGHNTPTTTRLTHGLSEMGFLQFTTRIISFTDFRRGQKLRKLSVLALFHVILYLSEEVFHFPDIWGRGRDDFRSEVHQGVSQLPVDATQWLDLLVSPQTSPSCVLALFLYLYFYSMTARSQDMLKSIYPAVVTFIRFTKGIESSVLLLKVVWFVFVVSQLSQSSSLESDIEVTNAMVSLLEAQVDLSLVYTHHPALLYWAFSSEVSRKIQTQTVHLWLQNKTPDCKELDEVMRKSSAARFAIFDILENGWGQELNSAFSSVKSLLEDSDDEEMASSVWFLLPQVLAKFTTGSTSVTTVDYVIELCSVKTPHGMEMTRIIRVASLLPEVLLKSDLISIIPALSLVLRLMQMGLQMEDHRIFQVFFQHDDFVLKILQELHSNVFEVSAVSIHIIILLWKECKNLKKPKKVEISKETILKLFETDCEEVLSAACLFLQEILMTNFKSPVFYIKDIDVDFVEILFLQIQNVCVKSAADVSRHCWHCMKAFLTLEHTGDFTKFDFITHPLLPEVVLLHLPRLEDSEEFKEFLSLWVKLHYVNFSNFCFERKIFGGSLEEIVQKVSRKLSCNLLQKGKIKDNSK